MNLPAVNIAKPSILTNMAYWQSPEWIKNTDSIYELSGANRDPDFLPWWREAWLLFQRSRRYDVVLTMGIRESFAYALLCWLAGRDSRQIMCEVFIDQARPDRFTWRIKTQLHRWLAGRALGFITNSTSEIQTNARRFGVPESRFRYVPLSSTIDQPERILTDAGYFFCGGRTLRDYQTLKKVMLATGHAWHVVTGATDLLEEALPDRITVHREIPREKYLDLLRGAKLVVLPLLSTERATGQVVLLEAMSYGKPCITTRAPGTVDIIRDGENGFLAEPGNADQMIELIRQIEQHPTRASTIGQTAFDTIISNHSHARHTTMRLEAIRELWSSRQK